MTSPEVYGPSSGPGRSGGLDEARGVLHPYGAAGRITLDRVVPAPELAPFVDYYWHVRWDMRGRSPYEQKVLSHPHVHLVLEQPRASVYGVDRGLFVRRLEGRGQVLGIRFTAGGFRPFWDRPVQELADRVLPAVEVLGPLLAPAVQALSDEVLALEETDAMAALADDFLLTDLPADDPQAAEVAAMVAMATEDRSLVRVEQLAERCEVSVRGLQRLFAEYVGAGPKWVLRRARLQEAAQRADGNRVDWSGLAADLGYADQAHFSRDFTTVVGLPPTRYARR